MTKVTMDSSLDSRRRRECDPIDLNVWEKVECGFLDLSVLSFGSGSSFVGVQGVSLNGWVGNGYLLFILRLSCKLSLLPIAVYSMPCNPCNAISCPKLT